MSHSRTYIYDLSELQAGDILLFCSDKSLSATMISLSGMLFNQPYGHHDTTHAAICVETKDSNPTIVHITGHDIMGYIKEPISEVFARTASGDRAFLIFRPDNPVIANQIAKIAASDENKQVKWCGRALMQTVITPAALDKDRLRSTNKSIVESSFCSKFVIQCMKKATARLEAGQSFYPDIRSTISPKSLESYLYQHPHYKKYIYPQKNIYEKIKKIIINQIQRLSDECTEDPIKLDKVIQCSETFYRCIEANEWYQINQYEKSLLLLKNILPKLNVTTGMILINAKAYQIVIDAVREFGIYKEDIEAYQPNENILFEKKMIQL